MGGAGAAAPDGSTRPGPAATGSQGTIAACGWAQRPQLRSPSVLMGSLCNHCVCFATTLGQPIVSREAALPPGGYAFLELGSRRPASSPQSRKTPCHDSPPHSPRLAHCC
ncbi:MAG: hypothetical protein RJA70_2205 [Pseudomonadota bacterium]